MISPDTNCAPRAASNSSSLRRRNSASDSRCLPKTFTSWCPVNASSMWALRAPVLRHWAMNSFCARLPMNPVMKTDAGTTASAISDSSGEIVSIMTITPMTVSNDVISWLSVCCRVEEMLSMSLVTRESSSPRGWPSK